jgi:hypothetical protein
MCIGCKILNSKEALKAGIVDQIISARSNVSEDSKNDKGRGQDREGDSSADNKSQSDFDYEDTIARVVKVIENQVARGPSAPHPYRRTSTLPVQCSYSDALNMAYQYTVANNIPAPGKGGLAAHACIEALLACVKAGDAFARGAVAESEISK